MDSGRPCLQILELTLNIRAGWQGLERTREQLIGTPHFIDKGIESQKGSMDHPRS